MEHINVPRTRIGMTFADHARIMFEAQRAEARGEFRDMTENDGQDVTEKLGEVAFGISPEEGILD